ncbi:MAG: ribosomal RNA small subunit methyltransferase A [Candidatus Lloydbacteria bacterium RIFCSPHIGHO2_02_FULL_54_17]|uniref:Ribosomal RNA small subunit methyltransferase A n=1 Tax=Candidatus Lloydbacteria bacterium RIFCSPHIGHO2_02_FULL_54_17 TaxID=1798664 RepID=A0A1G2DF92_9BACT|nr:MAG: ribosomal RNA small subunit methyltransferase A [Candidatus Lloydbacteria bacterium RIFCSPHIGHO2_01_FULL_54_11]OGZ12279.1 MAG: ribosomal RNA small subunit methyltransferase A [Candidatus Lloydbacteria bacterium RIFCSPHIGHO2_02_FULL_54_17]OGZ13983.1 MAG: ribosomal RNA small subunit methyltransferase A [Candidatus Lloydbacteria bacterium RIFCSPLOWO2_01_FULL_54_18]OGZ16413.1 MAG: ribosomal RNA small subunit methyltransferase A [Candidatus Lloydbacteria bacterium RIFCSPLOWO2_02_FULL_54_12]
MKTKKSLGQHFLRSKDALHVIIEAAGVREGETVLEIGPGEGVLTEALLFAGAQVVAVETDSRCVMTLNERFAEAIRVRHLILVEGDIRDERVAKKLFQKQLLGAAPYKLVANIPYYLTGMLFRLFLERLRQPLAIVFLVQKEVAEQLSARDGKESIFSLSVKIYGEPRYVTTVKRQAFVPPPKVDSAVVAVDNISRARLKGLRDERYFRVVKAGLGAKRKMLLGNLAHELKISREKLERIFGEVGIDLHARGEDVPVEKWIALAQALK